MSEKRLEEIEAKYSTLTVSSERGGIEYIEVGVKDLVFLIQNGFKQSERIQELELEIDGWREEVQEWQQFYKESEESHLETKELLRSTISEIKRYREYLGLIKATGTYGKDISTGEIIRSNEANLAEEALEGEE